MYLTVLVVLSLFCGHSDPVLKNIMRCDKKIIFKQEQTTSKNDINIVVAWTMDLHVLYSPENIALRFSHFCSQKLD